MGYNKIPLALKFNDDTGNAEGLIEFQLNLSDVGDVCTDAPTGNQALVYNADLNKFCPSTLPAPGEFTGNLSDVGGVCTATPEYGQVLTFSDTGGGNGVWCASTVQTGGGGGVTSINGDSGPAVTLDLNNINDVTVDTVPDNYEVLAYNAGWKNQTAAEIGYISVDPTAWFSEEGEIVKYNGTNLEVDFPDTVFLKVQNADSVNLNAGDAVYVTTAVHATERLRVAKANASNSSKMPAVGVVHTNTITPGNNGLIVAFGKALINTTGMTTPTPGQVLYVDTADGQITNEKPTGGTELIQNIGILSVTGTNGRMKVTGVGRSNDIPNNLDVVGSVTVGDTVISQTDAKLANVDADHILISTAASATSSVASATLFSNYYTKSEVYTQAQANAQFLEETTNLTGIADVTGTPDANYILQRNSGDNNWDPVTMNAALLATGERVEDHNIEDLANVSQGETPSWPDGCILQYSNDSSAFVSANLPGADSFDHGGLIGLGDDDHTQYVLADGTRAITGDLSTVGVSATSGSVATTPTAANHIANKSYVDSQIPTPSYFQALASGNINSVADEALTILGWSGGGTYALSDPGGNVVLDDSDTPDLSVINISGTGVYQIDATVRISNNTERGGIVFRIYLDTGSGFTDIPELRTSNYASRGTGSGEGITNGSCSINTILSLNAGDSLQFRAQPKTAGATSTIQQEGTYVRIIKIA